MNYDFDVVAACSALGGAVIGALLTAYRLGQHSKMVETKIDGLAPQFVSLNEKIVYISDELARRVTVLENRIQYDGLYTTPRLKRLDGQ